MKWRPAEGLAAGLAGIALAGALAMMPAHAASERALFISLGAAARAPVGWKEFCVEYAPECDTAPLAPTDVVLTSQDWNELVRINERVNDTVKPLTDIEHWGVAERWNYPDDGFGDCEDYVLLKREFILDNQTADVLLWSQTEYRFVKRQSQTDPNVWIALGDPRPAPATATSR